MTVEQLIELLSASDKSLKVAVSCEHSGFDFPHPLYAVAVVKETSDGELYIVIGQSMDQLELEGVEQ